MLNCLLNVSFSCNTTNPGSRGLLFSSVLCPHILINNVNRQRTLGRTKGQDGDHNPERKIFSLYHSKSAQSGTCLAPLAQMETHLLNAGMWVLVLSETSLPCHLLRGPYSMYMTYQGVYAYAYHKAHYVTSIQ